MIVTMFVKKPIKPICCVKTLIQAFTCQITAYRSLCQEVFMKPIGVMSTDMYHDLTSSEATKFHRKVKLFRSLW